MMRPRERGVAGGGVTNRSAPLLAWSLSSPRAPLRLDRQRGQRGRTTAADRGRHERPRGGRRWRRKRGATKKSFVVSRTRLVVNNRRDRPPSCLFCGTRAGSDCTAALTRPFPAHGGSAGAAGGAERAEQGAAADCVWCTTCITATHVRPGGRQKRAQPSAARRPHAASWGRRGGRPSVEGAAAAAVAEEQGDVLAMARITPHSSDSAPFTLRPLCCLLLMASTAALRHCSRRFLCARRREQSPPVQWTEGWTGEGRCFGVLFPTRDRGRLSLPLLSSSFFCSICLFSPRPLSRRRPAEDQHRRRAACAASALRF